MGSKRALLEEFGSGALTDGAVVAINGFLPAVTAKHVLAAAAATLTRKPTAGCGCAELLQMIRVRLCSMRHDSAFRG